MIEIIHGGQTGVDRGAHDGALANGWTITGYMPRGRRDEAGTIPSDVANRLIEHSSESYADRTEANVQQARAALIVVHGKALPRETPGTAITIDLVERRLMPYQIVDPWSVDPTDIATWLWNFTPRQTSLLPVEHPPIKLLVAGPRESKWSGAQQETRKLLCEISLAIAQIRTPRTI